MAEQPTFHESFERAKDVKAGSDRNFGLVFAFIFAATALLPLRSGGEIRWWALVVAAILLLAALIRPRVLAMPNRLWARLGAILHRVVTPVILGLLFYLAVTPTALILRLMGRDPLRLRLDRQASTYWISRQPPGPEPQSMRQQF